MKGTLIGLLILFALVGFQWGSRYWKALRFRRYWQRGQAALAASNLAGAEAPLRACVRLAPVAAPMRRILGGVLARLGNLAEAEEQLRFGAQLEPRNAAGHMDLGFFLAVYVPGRTDDAIDAFAAAVTCAPEMRQTLAAEPRLAPLRRHARFRDLLELRDA